jgi:predicted ATPase
MMDGCGLQEGMQKEIFSAFVAELEHHCRSILVGVDTDYRRVMATPVFAKVMISTTTCYPLLTNHLQAHWLIMHGTTLKASHHHAYNLMKSFLETRQLAAMCDEFFPVDLK